jgi:hypothetical protein
MQGEPFCYLYTADSHVDAWLAFISECWDNDVNGWPREPRGLTYTPGDKNSWVAYDEIHEAVKVGHDDSKVRIVLRERAKRDAVTRGIYNPAGITKYRERRWAIFGVHPINEA